MMAGPSDQDESQGPTFDFFMLADRAEVVNGKLYVMGGAYDTHIVQDIRKPVLVSFALGILLPPGVAQAEHVVEIRMEEAATGERLPLNLRVTISPGGEPPPPELPARILLALPAAPLEFRNPGVHYAVARILGGAERHLAFRVVSMQT